jgi:hypothetical protein
MARGSEGRVRAGREREENSQPKKKGRIDEADREKGFEQVMGVEDQSKAEDWSG